MIHLVNVGKSEKAIESDAKLGSGFCNSAPYLNVKHAHTTIEPILEATPVEHDEVIGVPKAT